MDYGAYKAWLRELKAGDEVAYRYFGPVSYTFHTVDRTTATQIIVNGVRYRRDSGTQVGGSSWHRKSLEHPATAREHIAEREAQKSVEEKRRDLVRLLTRIIEGADLERLLEIKDLIGPKAEGGE